MPARATPHPVLLGGEAALLLLFSIIQHAVCRQVWIDFGTCGYESDDTNAFATRLHGKVIRGRYSMERYWKLFRGGRSFTRIFWADGS
ncbi:hypothetical protein N431DRAFT_430283 [Stipitochalara longipes BDJ]|nr:hypothetical protein N431DRAFT_430283 [Stipitochalara longipes BDJ]